MGHYYHSQKTRFPIAEIVRLKYSPSYNNGFFLDNLDLRINLQTGLAWKPYDEKNALYPLFYYLYYMNLNDTVSN